MIYTVFKEKKKKAFSERKELEPAVMEKKLPTEWDQRFYYTRHSILCAVKYIFSFKKPLFILTRITLNCFYGEESINKYSLS